MSHIPARTFNRRTFAKGVGWAAPAVVASAAVPAYAASICEVRTAPSFRLGRGLLGTPKAVF